MNLLFLQMFNYITLGVVPNFTVPPEIYESADFSPFRSTSCIFKLLAFYSSDR